MEHLLIRRHHSRNTLFLVFIFGIATAGLVLWNLDFINAVYFRDQLTPTGQLINGAIAGLFFVGMAKIVTTLLHYIREENALAHFIANMDEGPAEEPLSGINESSLISHRYHTMKALHQAKTPINHSALASTLVAAESTRNSVPRFIGNILILTGVFGTIVSLSLALLGASDMLEGSVNVGGMGIVIHGMSTALSTTITAIVCYLFFGFFMLKLNDVQTNLVSGIEQVTTLYLVPRFEIKTENILFEFNELLQVLQLLIRQMERSQTIVNDLENQLNVVFEDQGARATRMADELSAIKHTLQDGVEKRIGHFFDQNSKHSADMSEELGKIKGLLKHGFRLSDS